MVSFLPSDVYMGKLLTGSMMVDVGLRLIILAIIMAVDGIGK